MTAEVATSSAIGAVSRNPMYRNFVETQHAIGSMNFDDFEATLRSLITNMYLASLMKIRTFWLQCTLQTLDKACVVVVK